MRKPQYVLAITVVDQNLAENEAVFTVMRRHLVVWHENMMLSTKQQLGNYASQCHQYEKDKTTATASMHRILGEGRRPCGFWDTWAGTHIHTQRQAHDVSGGRTLLLNWSHLFLSCSRSSSICLSRCAFFCALRFFHSRCAIDKSFLQQHNIQHSTTQHHTQTTLSVITLPRPHVLDPATSLGCATSHTSPNAKCSRQLMTSHYN